MNKIVIINGLGGCGKSTFIQLCKKYGESALPDLKVHELSSVDFVKGVAVFCGWDGSKTTKNRTFLHDIKVLLERWDNVPNKKVLEDINALKKLELHNIFFVNIRENYNIDNFKNMAKEQNFPCITLCVTNPNNKTNEVIELIEQIDSYPYDAFINNDGDLSHLSHLAQEFIKELLKGENI